MAVFCLNLMTRPKMFQDVLKHCWYHWVAKLTSKLCNKYIYLLLHHLWKLNKPIFIWEFIQNGANTSCKFVLAFSILASYSILCYLHFPYLHFQLPLIRTNSVKRKWLSEALVFQWLIFQSMLLMLVLPSDVVFRVKQLDCFSACNYQIGDRAYYCLKPDNRLISFRSNMKCDKPAVLTTFLHREGLLFQISDSQPDNMQKPNNFSTTLSACSGLVANGTVNCANQVILLLISLFVLIVFYMCYCLYMSVFCLSYSLGFFSQYLTQNHQFIACSTPDFVCCFSVLHTMLYFSFLQNCVYNVILFLRATCCCAS